MYAQSNLNKQPINGHKWKWLSTSTSVMSWQGANPIYRVLCRLGDGCFFSLFSSFSSFSNQFFFLGGELQLMCIRSV
jgi:hypothetical protein